jgi:hypothetical protein
MELQTVINSALFYYAEPVFTEAKPLLGKGLATKRLRCPKKEKTRLRFRLRLLQQDQ